MQPTQAGSLRQGSGWEDTTGHSRVPGGGTGKSEPGCLTLGQCSIHDWKGWVDSDTTVVPSEASKGSSSETRKEERPPPASPLVGRRAKVQG